MRIGSHDTVSSDHNAKRILHCFRSPVGGIFRHVRDLIQHQSALGHDVGVICDDNTGGPLEEHNLRMLVPYLKLGLHRVSMKRSIGPSDAIVLYKLYRSVRKLQPDVIHSHGAKGGAYARIIGALSGIGRTRPVSLYCPHGGSMHYDPNTLSGKMYFGLERQLERFTDHLLFVSAYERDGYFTKVGEPSTPHTLVRNGLLADEFVPVESHQNATDFVYIGMMRDLKGVDLLLDALPIVAKKLNRTISVTLVGDGPDLERYKGIASRFGDNVKTIFKGPLPARDAFGLGQTLVVPSRSESLPYIVLEALAAKRPVLATDAGGIPEIYGAQSGALVACDNFEALTDAMTAVLSGTYKLPDPDLMVAKMRKDFSLENLSENVLAAYTQALCARDKPSR